MTSPVLMWLQIKACTCSTSPLHRFSDEGHTVLPILPFVNLLLWMFLKKRNHLVEDRFLVVSSGRFLPLEIVITRSMSWHALRTVHSCAAEGTR